MTPHPEQVLATTLPPNDSGKDTVGGYLIEMIGRVWAEGEGFSGKRPFGSSGWECDLTYPLEEAFPGCDPRALVVDAIRWLNTPVSDRRPAAVASGAAASYSRASEMPGTDDEVPDEWVVNAVHTGSSVQITVIHRYDGSQVVDVHSYPDTIARHIATGILAVVR